MIGRAFEAMGIEGLRQLRDSLSRDQRRALITALQVHEAGWEPAADVYARELVWRIVWLVRSHEFRLSTHCPRRKPSSSRPTTGVWPCLDC